MARSWTRTRTQYPVPDFSLDVVARVYVRQWLLLGRTGRAEATRTIRTYSPGKSANAITARHQSRINQGEERGERDCPRCSRFRPLIHPLRSEGSGNRVTPPSSSLPHPHPLFLRLHVTPGRRYTTRVTDLNFEGQGGAEEEEEGNVRNSN